MKIVLPWPFCIACQQWCAVNTEEPNVGAQHPAKSLRDPDGQVNPGTGSGDDLSGECWHHAPIWEQVVEPVARRSEGAGGLLYGGDTPSCQYEAQEIGQYLAAARFTAIGEYILV